MNKEPDQKLEQVNSQVDRKKRAKVGRWIAFVLMLLALGAQSLHTIRLNTAPEESHKVSEYVPWEDRVIEVAGDMPLQDGGRIKPFASWAGFTMLKLHGDRSMKIIAGEKTIKLTPEEVLMDCLFRPEMARKLPVFRIDDGEIIKSLSIEDLDEATHMSHMTNEELDEIIKEATAGKDRRDRYTYEELEHVAPILIARAQKIRKDQPNKSKMTSAQRHVVDLADTVWLFMRLVYHMDFVRADIDIMEGTPALDKERMQRMSYWIKSFPVLAKAVREMKPDGEKLPPQLMSLFSDLELRMRRSSEDVKFVPPYDEGAELWSPMGKRIEAAITGDRTHAKVLIEDMQKLEDAVIALRKEGQGAFAEKLSVWKASVHERVGGEVVDSLQSEVKYGDWNYFYRALVIFLVAFFFVMVSWLAPRSVLGKVFTRIALSLGVVALVLMVVGIAHRSYIMERSPVGNLYDTIIFIGATGVLVLLLTEVITKRMVALGLAIFMGMVCMFLARRYEMGDAKDHMDPLVAVLKSNFWLSTHVVTVTIGYMGGLAAAGLSAIYLFARILGIDEGDKRWRRAMTRIAYGMICFTLFFSLIGTVLGGIWANDSWGRFWGWDPKENGALMIVLWCLILLHARLAGYIREWGLHIATVFGANIVAFSWWHVNSLGTGLHSYGFIDGMGAIWTYYYIMGGICLVGAVAATISKVSTKKTAA